MRGNRNQKILFYVIIGLIVIGALSMVARNPGGAIIPVVVLGGVFLLYKYPPHTWKSLFRDVTSRRAGMHKSKRAKFKVIPGTKRSDDEPPKYH